MMMKRKISIALCCAAVLIALSGCQLAREDEGAGASDDRLIGVFITTEHLNLFDMESYLNDNLKGFSGGEIVVDGGTQKYQGRLYATLKTTTLTNEESGEITETEDFVFENVDGFPYFAAVIHTLGGSSYTSLTGGEAISDGGIEITEGDDEDILTITATIYVSPTDYYRAFYMNPVYQSADGSVYLTAGTGISAQMNGEGMQMSQSMDEARTVTENGKSKTEKTSVKVSVSALFAPEKIVILQMGANGKLISSADYAPDKMPESFRPEAGTEYLIAETHKRDAEGKPLVSRAVFEADAQSVETFVAGPDGICVKHSARIEW